MSDKSSHIDDPRKVDPIACPKCGASIVVVDAWQRIGEDTVLAGAVALNADSITTTETGWGAMFHMCPITVPTVWSTYS